MRFSVIILTAAALSLCTVNQPMAMEQPKQALGEAATIALEKLDMHYDMIQNYLSEEVIKIKYSAATNISLSEPKKLTDLENQRIQRLNELSEALISVQNNSKTDVFLNQQYVSTNPHINPRGDKKFTSIEVNGSCILENKLNLLDKIKKILEDKTKENKTVSSTLGAQFLNLHIILTKTQVEELKEDGTYILELFSKPNSYLLNLHQICLSLFSEIAQPWCGSRVITNKYISEELIPNLKKLKFENQTKEMKLNCKISTSYNDTKISSFKEKLAAEEKMAERLTCVIQSLESASHIESAFCDAYKSCSNDHLKQILEIRESKDNPY